MWTGLAREAGWIRQANFHVNGGQVNLVIQSTKYEPVYDTPETIVSQKPLTNFFHKLSQLSGFPFF